MDNLIKSGDVDSGAAKNGGNPYLADIAVSHADKTMKYQFRPDYTSCHVAVYDTLDGGFYGDVPIRDMRTIQCGPVGRLGEFMDILLSIVKQKMSVIWILCKR